MTSSILIYICNLSIDTFLSDITKGKKKEVRLKASMCVTDKLGRDTLLFGASYVRVQDRARTAMVAQVDDIC